jgi:hypothetical protein
MIPVHEDAEMSTTTREALAVRGRQGGKIV